MAFPISNGMKNKRVVWEVAVGTILIAAAFLFVDQEKARQPKIVFRTLATYTNPDFKISLAYPSTWQVNLDGRAFNKKPLSYKGGDGFFAIDALVGADRIDLVKNIKLDDVARRLAQDPTKPYGSSLKNISHLTVVGVDARLVVASPDQSKEAKEKSGGAAIIIQYPRPISIGSHVYLYFMLYGDKLHLREIAGTLKFVGL